MKSRVLPILNAIGCLILTALVVVLWNRERIADQALSNLKSELRTAHEQTATEAKRAADLERDIAALKESIASSQRAAAEQATQSSGLQNEVSAARDQLKTWQVALAERDAKLRALSAELAATRQRLDAAIAQLKAAGAR